MVIFTQGIKKYRAFAGAAITLLFYLFLKYAIISAVLYHVARYGAVSGTR